MELIRTIELSDDELPQDVEVNSEEEDSEFEFSFQDEKQDQHAPEKKQVSVAQVLREQGEGRRARDKVDINEIIKNKLQDETFSEKIKKSLESEVKLDEEDEPEPQAYARQSINTALPDTSISFESLNFSRPILRAIHAMNFKHPTPVQAKTIPAATAGDDLLVSAVTGSGKTAAFVLPILERLVYRSKRVPLSRVLILCPTRELAAQCFEVVTCLTKTTDITAALVVGGLSEQRQAVTLKQRPDIIIGTPGRILDHLTNTVSVHVEDVEILVLDEADRLLEMGFVDEVQEIVQQCPKTRQTMMFSATISHQVEALVKASMKENHQRIAVDPLYSLAHSLSQEFIRVRPQHDSESCRMGIVLALCTRSFTSRTIVFFPSKTLAHKMKIVFGLLGLRAAELHGNLTQVQRLEALEHFRDAKVDFLLCTDLAARGLDIKGVQTVINLSLPKQLEQYVHRVGRTARAGQGGHAVSLIGDDNHQMLAAILKRAPQTVKRRKISPKVIEEASSKIAALEGSIEEILEQERLERSMRIAEMEMSKSENMIVHHDEIMSRPAKTWFMSGKDKRALKEKSKGSISDEAQEPVKLKKTQKPETELSEGQKRHLEDIKIQHPKKRALKISVKAKETKKEEPLEITAPKKKRKRYTWDHGQVSEFDRRYANSFKKEEEVMESAPKKKKKKTSNFKSKKKYKRR